MKNLSNSTDGSVKVWQAPFLYCSESSFLPSSLSLSVDKSIHLKTTEAKIYEWVIS